LSGNGFRKGLEQALHVLQLRPSFIQPVSSQRRQTGSLRGGGAAVLATATCLLVSSLSRFPIAVVSSMIDPFIFSSSVVLSVKWARSHLFASGLSNSTRLLHVGLGFVAVTSENAMIDHSSSSRSIISSSFRSASCLLAFAAGGLKFN